MDAFERKIVKSEIRQLRPAGLPFLDEKPMLWLTFEECGHHFMTDLENQTRWFPGVIAFCSICARAAGAVKPVLVPLDRMVN